MMLNLVAMDFWQALLKNQCSKRLIRRENLEKFRMRPVLTLQNSHTSSKKATQRTSREN
jgi:hypothetical protein